MQRTGASSWQLGESVEQMLHVLLYVRDTLALPVPAGASPPPADPLPDRAPVAGPDADRMASAWLRWWHDHVARTALIHGGDSLPTAHRAPDRARALRAARDIGDPPDFTGVDDEDLRTAASTHLSGALQWADRARSRSVPSGHLPYELVREAAEEVIAQYGADPGAVGAVVFPLAVGGLWWQVWAPGVVLCSMSAAKDPSTAPALLWDAFTSGL